VDDMMEFLSSRTACGPSNEDNIEEEIILQESDTPRKPENKCRIIND